ncbi:LOW QUALITY PROTEIN: Helitron helicase [Phytophthora megakarya]|uniref:ATP-dependent DNA helicase n=1 Tax=Phytophthora megakarya TaxID=4795 RepID=A0A225UY51_9STRA|nr:LOW QUALITY PROTEIN: Helitron helicase [Phytophthora megakarya]
MVFSGDHRQILPVLKDATRAETLEVCFKSSPLWNHFKKLRLTENMRVRTAPDPASAADLNSRGFYFKLARVNSDISENDICLPRDICIIPEERGHYRWDDEEPKESEDMEAPQTLIFFLLQNCLLKKAILILTMIAESETSTL